MENYIEHVPAFAVFVIIGIVFNLVRKKVKKQPITVWRVIEEIFGTLWISLIITVVLDQYTNNEMITNAAIGSFFGFSHSYVIDVIGKGLLQSITDKIKDFRGSKNES